MAPSADADLPPSGPPPEDKQRAWLEEQARLAQRLSIDRPDSAAQVDHLIHELSVHQVELELQNEELQRAHLAIEASRDRYLDLYENAPVAYLTFSLGGDVVQSNRRAHMLLGRPAAELARRRMSDVIAPEHRPRFQQHLTRVLSGRGEQAFEIRLALPSGALCWVEVHMSLVHGGDGGPQARAALVDVTERVQAQQGAAQLAAIVASSEDAIVSRDIEGRVTSWNQAAERLFGRSASQMTGRTMDELVPDAQLDHEQDLLRQVRADRPSASIQTERFGAGGAPRPVSMSLSPIHAPGGDVTGSALIARDITELRRAEQALAERVRQLDVLASAGRELILGPSGGKPLPRGLFEKVGRAVGGDIHLSYIVGADCQTLEARGAMGLPEPVRAAMTKVRMDDSLCGLVAQRRAPVVIDDLQHSDVPQVRVLKEAGARAYAGFPLVAHERLYGVAAFASTTHDRFDAADLQVIQTVCSQASAMLERAELLDELHLNEDALKRADRAKDEFIATLAHELRNPLAPIRNALAILKRDEHEGAADPRRTAWCRDLIDRQVKHMTHLLEDLLDVSRVTRNQIVLRSADIDLRRAIEQAIETSRPLFEARRHRLHLDMPEEPVPFHGDLTRLTQVFTNMLTNAGKYTDPRGNIELVLRHDQDEITVTVCDDGIGIESDQLSRVFEMFAQLTPALERSAGGLGIGLALTRGLVELHGGRIEAHSEGPGKGSKFVVRLPAQPDTRPADLDDDTAGGARSASKRVLVIDDNVDAAESMGQLLTLDGHEVRVALGGVEGLRVAVEWHPECVLLDIGMADMNGYDVCRHIRAESWGREAQLVACTGWGQKSDRDRAHEAGFDAHLVKPVEPRALVELLARGSKSAR